MYHPGVRIRSSTRSLLSLLILGAAACGEVLPSNPDATTDGPNSDATSLPDCKAQRLVHLVGGSGGFAWFTFMWPIPAVITNFQAAYAYDAPSAAQDVGTEPGHPLYARRIGARALWQGHGQAPQPTVLVAGNNETHTATPSSIAISGGIGLAAASAALQTSLRPTFGALAISSAGPYGQAAGAPALVAAPNVNGAVNVFQGSVSQAVLDQLQPSASQVARYVPPGAGMIETTFGTQLAFAANAFRLGLLGTVLLPAFNDDPHSAFTGNPSQRANNLATMLDAFYSDLAMANETTCGRGGGPLSLADNTVMVITGDTPKNSFVRDGWPDGTVGASNWMYARTNGFTRPGWFGQITSAARTNFNPTTGALDAGTATATATAASFASVLYAVARGDKTKVRAFTAATYDGVIKP